MDAYRLVESRHLTGGAMTADGGNAELVEQIRQRLRQGG